MRWTIGFPRRTAVSLRIALRRRRPRAGPEKAAGSFWCPTARAASPAAWRCPFRREGRRAAAKLLAPDEARRIAVNEIVWGVLKKSHCALAAKDNTLAGVPRGFPPRVQRFTIFVSPFSVAIGYKSRCGAVVVG